VAGDRHAFYAGLAASALPPKNFDPVGVAFVTASISMVNSFELLLASLPPEHPLKALYVREGNDAATFEPVINMLLRHGVRSGLKYASTGDVNRRGACRIRS